MNEKDSQEKCDSLETRVKTATLGLVASFTAELVRSEYFRKIVSGILDALGPTPYGFRLILVRDEEWSQTPEKVLARYKVDGLLLLTWRLHALALEKIQETEGALPFVAINDYAPGNQVNLVYTDATEGARLAMRYLLNKGYSRFGMLQAPNQDSLDGRERERVFREMLEQHGLELNPAHFVKCDYFFEEDAYVKTLEMIHATKTLPRVLFCFNDDLAIGALRALQEEKISVPHQVAVMGFDGIDKGKYVLPALTTIGQPLEQMGGEMVKILLGLIRGGLAKPVQVRFEPQLVVRQSA